jgi:hypothetical protein
MKRYLVILLVLSMILSLPMAVHGEDNATPSPIRLNLDQANKLMEANNLEIKLLDKKIEIKVSQFEDVLDAADEARRQNKSDTSLQLKKTEVLTPKQQWLQIDIAKNDRLEKFKSLKSDVKQQYINILLIQKDMSYIKEDIVSIDKKLEEIKLRMQLGQAKESDYKSLYSQKLSIQNQLNLLNTQLETSMINFKALVGIELTQPIVLEDLTLPYQVVDKNNLKNNILNSISTDFTFTKLNKDLELKNFEIELTKKYDDDYRFDPEYKDLLLEVTEIEAETKYEKLNLEASRWIEYYNILVLEDTIKLEEVNLEIQKINYDATTAKAKLGMIDSVTELNAKIAYDRQKNTLQRAMYDYIMAVEKFNDKLTNK